MSSLTNGDLACRRVDLVPKKLHELGGVQAHDGDFECFGRGPHVECQDVMMEERNKESEEVFKAREEICGGEYEKTRPLFIALAIS